MQVFKTVNAVSATMWVVGGILPAVLLCCCTTVLQHCSTAPICHGPHIAHEGIYFRNPEGPCSYISYFYNFAAIVAAKLFLKYKIIDPSVVHF